jgi:anaphase-promoting complex subunit 2
MTIRTPASMAGRRRVFDSVFPSSRLKDLAPTPVLAQTGFVQSFGGPAMSPISSSPNEPLNAYPEQVIWDRAWHSATSFLSLPGRNLVEQRRQQDLESLAAHYNKPSKDAAASIRYVISHQRAEGARDRQTGHENIIEWYTDHVRGHFLAYSKPFLLRVSSG